MLAAETIFEALKVGDASAKTLSSFQTKIEQSYIKKELWKVRNFHQGFAHGQLADFSILRCSRLRAVGTS